ncbi:hypothetical protein B296_00027968 [Ensete ventricosum]|uniref:Uncharacterized protein n=1 Tax=Ensete ventricosum TaxID=4639 RepID=A0A426ZP16_ENSVE|nr:hypothetical protein B296_00027968 [Ensete ventricosum]
MSPQSERVTHMGVILTPRFAFFCETTACYASRHAVAFFADLTALLITGVAMEVDGNARRKSAVDRPSDLKGTVLRGMTGDSDLMPKEVGR